MKIEWEQADLKPLVEAGLTVRRIQHRLVSIGIITEWRGPIMTTKHGDKTVPFEWPDDTGQLLSIE